MSLSILFRFRQLLNKKAARVEVNISLAFLHWVGIALHPWPFVCDIAIFVLKGDVKLQLWLLLLSCCLTDTPLSVWDRLNPNPVHYPWDFTRRGGKGGCSAMSDIFVADNRVNARDRVRLSGISLIRSWRFGDDLGRMNWHSVEHVTIPVDFLATAISPRDAMLMRYIICCGPICLSVRLSVCFKPVLHQNG